MPSSRVFLVVVDDSPEMRAALRFASRRAKSSDGQVALLRVIEPAEYQHFASIGNLMRAEARENADILLNRLAGDVNALSGHQPLLFV
ncbi:MAG: universal stress protein, partial [Rhodospirillaceae bacterium]|nr:universal stress protein [Rhodospirillaceae bacterium]